MTQFASPQTPTLTFETYTVIHPLEDVPEEKRDPTALGHMPITGATRVSLIALRAYLIIMVLLVLYRVLSLAGILP